MGQANINDALVLISQDIFDDEDLTIHESTSAKEIENWDSIQHLNLILKIEEKWNINFLPTNLFYLKM
jgi:acyl carrier protein